MSAGGWIKLEKDLLTDPRLLKMAHRIATSCNGRPLPGVMVALGGLAQLWIIADTHIGNDDILPLGIDQINHILGMQGFCEILPQDWLQVIDADNVKLPGFHKHNGTIAKQNALNRRRVGLHRSLGNGKPLHVSNGQALPDLDLDLDHKKKNNKKKIACRLPDEFALTTERSEYASTHGLSPSETFDAFCDYWRAANGANGIKRDWDAAWRTWVRSPYNQPKANGKALQPASVPAERISAEWSELLAAGRAEGLGEPYKLETPQAYAERLRGFRAKRGPRIDTSSLTAKLRGMA
jgi:hypothetical protein